MHQGRLTAIVVRSGLVLPPRRDVFDEGDDPEHEQDHHHDPDQPHPQPIPSMPFIIGHLFDVGPIPAVTIAAAAGRVSPLQGHTERSAPRTRER